MSERTGDAATAGPAKRGRPPSALAQRARACLGIVMDPCSVAAGRPVSILDMGLVMGIEERDGVVTVRLRTTFPGCTMAPHFAAAAEEQIGALPGVSKVEVRIDPQFTWTPDQMSDNAAAVMVGIRRRSTADLPVPWAWRTDGAPAGVAQ